MVRKARSQVSEIRENGVISIRSKRWHPNAMRCGNAELLIASSDSASRSRPLGVLDAASFIITDEKRVAAGYASLSDAPGDSPSSIPAFAGRPPGAKYAPDQPRVPAGQSGGGQWTDGAGVGSGSNNGRVRVAQADGGRSGYPINILEEDEVGGHTYAEHVGKLEEYLKARITGSRSGVPYIFGVGEKRAGSFPSVDAANKLVNSTVGDPENASKIEMFREAKFPFWLPELRIFKSFSSPTGIEAYSPDDRTIPKIRSTSGVTVRLIRTDRVQRGYYVDSAWPMNEE